MRLNAASFDVRRSFPSKSRTEHNSLGCGTESCTHLMSGHDQDSTLGYTLCYLHFSTQFFQPLCWKYCFHCANRNKSLSPSYKREKLTCSAPHRTRPAELQLSDQAWNPSPALRSPKLLHSIWAHSQPTVSAGRLLRSKSHWDFYT